MSSLLKSRNLSCGQKKQSSVTHHRKGFFHCFLNHMCPWLNQRILSGHEMLTQNLLLHQPPIIESGAKLYTWIWAVDETTITQWTRRRKRRRRRKDLNNFLYILHVNDLWELGCYIWALPHANKQIMCETKWVRELKSDPPPTWGFENKFNLIHRRTKSKRKWTQGKEEQFFSLLLEGEEQQKKTKFVKEHLLQNIHNNDNQKWKPNHNSSWNSFLSQPRGKRNFKPCLLPMYSFL